MSSDKTYFEYTHTLNTGEYDWYFEIKSRLMIRLPSGTKIKAYPQQKDSKGRILALTEIGDYIYVYEEDILELNFH